MCSCNKQPVVSLNGLSEVNAPKMWLAVAIALSPMVLTTLLLGGRR